MAKRINLKKLRNLGKKGLGRRALAMCMALVLSLSLVQITALATVAPEDQVDGYLGYYADGTASGTTYSNSTDAEKSIEDGAITMQKNITQTGENAFNINLIVTTTEQLENVDLSPDAAVVLVLDASQSMDYNDAGGTADNPTHQRIYEAQVAACDFVDSFVQDAGTAHRYVSVVSYNLNAKTEIGWTDANDATNSSQNITNIKKKINEITTAAWTDTDAALQLANNLLGLSTVSPIANKYVILLTDGQPNAVRDSAGSPTGVNGHNVGNNNSGFQTATTAAAATAASLKTGRKATLYTVAFATADATCYTYQTSVVTNHVCNETGWHQHTQAEIASNGYGSGKTGTLAGGDPQVFESFHEYDSRSSDWNWHGGNYYYKHYTYGYTNTNKATSGWFNGTHTGTTTANQTVTVTVGDWLTSIASTGCYRNAPSGDSVSIQLQDIITQIKRLLQAWQITDPMGDYIHYVGLTTPNSNVTVSPDQRTLTWNLWQDMPQVTSDPNGDIYTYSLTYSVTLDALAGCAAGMPADHVYPTNGATRLTYALNLLNEDGTLNTNADVQEDYFNIPSVNAIFYTVTLRHFIDDADQPYSTDTISKPVGYVIDLDSKILDLPYVTYNHRDSLNTAGETITTSGTTNGTVINYYYDSAYPLTVHYYEQGSTTEVAPVSTTNWKGTDTFSVASPAIPGWTLADPADATVTGAMDSQAQVRDVYYTQDNYGVTYQWTSHDNPPVDAPTDGASYHHGDTVTLATVSEPTGWKFSGWTGFTNITAGGVITGNATVSGSWSREQYPMDVVYSFGSDGDYQDYLSRKDAAGEAAAAALTQEDGESDEDFAARQSEASVAAETAFETAFVPGATFYDSYTSADGGSYSDVFVLNCGTKAYQDDYSESAAAVPNFKVAPTHADGTVTTATTVDFVMTNDLFVLTIQHQKLQKDGNYSTVATETSALNSGASYSVAESGYQGYHGVNANAAKLGTDLVMPDENVNIILQYDPDLFDAGFHFVGAAPISEPVSQNDIWYGDSVTQPAGMTAEGWSFDGWYTDESCAADTKYNFTSPVTDDVNLYGKWTHLENTVTFVFTPTGSIPGSAVVPAAQTDYYGFTATEPAAIDGSSFNTSGAAYTFDGWYLTASPSEGESKFDFSTHINSDTTLYGRWTTETQKYAYSVAHYFEDEADPFLTQQGPTTADYNYQITDTAAAGLQLRSGDLTSYHPNAHFVSATGCTISDNAENNVVKCYYSTDTYGLTIDYQYENGTTAAQAYTASIKVGGNYNVTSPTIANYTPNHAVISGTMPNESVHEIVTYVYTPPYVPPTGTNYTLTIQWVDANGTALAGSVARTISEGSTYNADSLSDGSGRTFDGYAYTGLAADSDAISGTMNGNKTVIFTYTGTAVIPPENPPLNENPGEAGATEIPEGTIPLAEAPKTGDELLLWILATAVSGTGLIWLAISGKKRKDDRTTD